jgi:hypothetical protein
MWCPSPLPEGELHRRKLRSDKYKPPAGRLLEFYKSDSSVEADEDTGDEAEGGDAGAASDAGGAAKVQRKTTRSAVGKQSASAAAAAVSAVKAAEKKKERKRRAASPPAVVTPSIPTPYSWEVESEEEEEEKEKDEAVEELPVPEDQATMRPKSPTAKRQRELVQKTSRMLSNVDWRRNVVLQQRRRGCLRLLGLRCFGRRLGFQLRRGKVFASFALYVVSCKLLSLQGVLPCRLVTRPQGGQGAPSSPPHTRSSGPQVVGEALADDARTATPPRGAVEGRAASSPVDDARVGTPPRCRCWRSFRWGRRGDGLPNDHRRRPHQCSPWWGRGLG